MPDYPFLQIHTLTSYPASLLNRDDVGFAKRIPIGGAARVRVSSQCLKRHWRTAEGPHALSSIDLGQGPVAMSVRSRVTFQKLVRDRLLLAGIDEELAIAATEEVMKLVLGESAKAKEGKKKKKDAEPEEDDDACKTNQLTVLGRPEVDFLYEEALAIAEAAKAAKGKDLAKKIVDAAKAHFTAERKKNLKGLRMGAGLDAALFGRMVTSDMLARTDAALHVAHAFTVHEEQTESDFFSAIDDLERQRDDAAMGSGHIGSAELTTGLFYGYVAVDLPLLISNLSAVERQHWREHRGALPAEIIRRVVRLIATISPGAKLGSTAPHSYATFVLAERGAEQPRSLANAFLKPVRPNGDVLTSTYHALAQHLGDLEQMFGAGPQRRFAAMGPVDALAPVLSTEQRSSLDELANWLAAAAMEA